MGGRFDSSALLTLPRTSGNFPGGIRGTAEAGHVRTSEGIWIDDIIGILNSQKAQRLIKIPVGKSPDRRDRPVSTLPQIPLVGPRPRIFREDVVLTETNGGSTPPYKAALPRPQRIVSPVFTPKVNERGPAPSVAVSTNQGGIAMPSVTEFLRDVLPGDSDIFDMGANLIGMFGGNQTSGGGLPPQLPPTTNLPVAQSGGGMVPPNVGGGGSCGTSDPAQQYVLKFTCGEWKWVKKRKRRRKRLATSSDVKDLSSLKGVLGGGKSFDLWIATHS